MGILCVNVLTETSLGLRNTSCGDYLASCTTATSNKSKGILSPTQAKRNHGFKRSAVDPLPLCLCRLLFLTQPISTTTIHQNQTRKSGGCIGQPGSQIAGSRSATCRIECMTTWTSAGETSLDIISLAFIIFHRIRGSLFEKR